MKPYDVSGSWIITDSGKRTTGTIHQKEELGFARSGRTYGSPVIRPRNTRWLNCRSEQLGPRFSINVRSWLASCPSRDAGRRQSSARIPTTTCTYLQACKEERISTSVPSRPAWISTARPARAMACTSICLRVFPYLTPECIVKIHLPVDVYAYVDNVIMHHASNFHSSTIDLVCKC